MLCQNCHRREASVHVMHIKNNVMRELHLCNDCAAEQFTPGTPTGKQLLELLGQNQSAPGPTCPHCGATLLDFRRTGYVGCPHCYEVFHDQMQPMLLAVHGATQHVGQAGPPQPEATNKQRDEISDLRNKLRQAVRDERYEQAAELRDAIREAERGKDA